MNFQEFTGEVQHRLELPEMGEAVTATRAALTPLGERLHEGEASDLASPLPPEIGRFLTEAESGQRFGYDEYVERVAEIADVDEADANYYGQTVFALVAETVQPGNVEKVENSLPEEFDDLFELVGEDLGAQQGA